MKVDERGAHARASKRKQPKVFSRCRRRRQPSTLSARRPSLRSLSHVMQMHISRNNKRYFLRKRGAACSLKSSSSESGGDSAIAAVAQTKRRQLRACIGDLRARACASGGASRLATRRACALAARSSRFIAGQRRSRARARGRRDNNGDCGNEQSASEMADGKRARAHRSKKRERARAESGGFRNFFSPSAKRARALFKKAKMWVARFLCAFCC